MLDFLQHIHYNFAQIQTCSSKSEHTAKEGKDMLKEMLSDRFPQIDMIMVDHCGTAKTSSANTGC